MNSDSSPTAGPSSQSLTPPSLLSRRPSVVPHPSSGGAGAVNQNPNSHFSCCCWTWQHDFQLVIPVWT